MANLVNRLNNGLVPSREEFFTPFENCFNQFFNDFFADGINPIARSSYPKLDIITDDDKWIVEVALPGMEPEDVEVEVIPESRILKISGKSAHASEYESKAKWHIKELKRSAFERTIRLPENVEGDPEATMKNGVLKLVWTVVGKKPPARKMISITKAEK